MMEHASASAADALHEVDRALERALSAGQNRPERLPGLQMIFGQLPRVLVEEIGSLTVLPFNVHLIDMTASTIADTCALQQGSFAGVVRAERWRSWLYYIADPKLTALFVEAATGCEKIPPGGLSPRSVTRTDANVLRILFRRFSRAFSSAFSILADIEFDVGSVVEKIDLEPQLNLSSPVIAARLTFSFDGHEGVLTIVIPQVALDPVRDVLSSTAPAELASLAAASDADGDPAWAKLLTDEIARAFIDINGILEERSIALSEVQQFSVGSVIELKTASMSRVRLDAHESPMFWCELGKRQNALILRVDDECEREIADDFYGL
jgi:flagellar motor switch protein FliM